MRIYPVNHLPDTIIVGKQTEHGVHEIRVDCAPWLALWPDLSLSVWVTAPNGAGAYPANTHMEGDVLVWEVSAADTATAGTGCMEVMGVADSKKKLSATTTTRVFSTITDTSAEPPEPQQAWVEKVAQNAGRAEAAAEQAEGAAEEATKSASAAEAAAERAQQAAPQEGFNLVNGSAVGSVRGVNASEETDEYKMGKAATAFGSYTKASGGYSHAEGSGTTASGSFSHAEGANTTAVTSCAHAEGYGTTASGGSAHAEGYGTTASGAYSHAEGHETKAEKECSHAEGEGTTASAYCSHAEGRGTVSSYQSAHAEGENTTASGFAAHAEGYDTTASGFAAHAEGYGTTASGERQHVQGKYNIEDTENRYAHIVGNGWSRSQRSNAHTLDWDGNGWYAGYLESQYLILTSPNGTRWAVRVTDEGVLTVEAM